MRELEGKGFSKHQMVALDHDYIVFGHGKHAWYVSNPIRVSFSLTSVPVAFFSPGRFFAVNELKALLAYVLLNYDVSFKDNGPRPVDPWFGTRVAPDPKVSVMFRGRRV